MSNKPNRKDPSRKGRTSCALDGDPAWQSFTDSFLKVYSPVARQFVSQIAHISTDGMSEPFFPVAGRNYPTAPRRILFVGMERLGWGDMADFLSQARISMPTALSREQKAFESFYFLDLAASPQNNFWTFVLKFLAGFHGLVDWEQLKRRERPDIISSFAWANFHSIERYEVTAQGRGVRFDDWTAVKDASRILDGGDNLLRALAPQLVVILHWDGDEQTWLTEKHPIAERKKVADHLLYCRLSGGTHLIWTAHPNWLKSQKQSFDACVTKCVRLAKEKLLE